MKMRLVTKIAVRVAGLALLLAVLSWYFSYSIGTLAIYLNWWISLAVGALAGLAFGLSRTIIAKRGAFRMTGVVLLAAWFAFLAYQFIDVWIQYGKPFNT